jgi:hypothetical protein
MAMAHWQDTSDEQTLADRLQRGIVALIVISGAAGIIYVVSHLSNLITTAIK